MIEKKNKIITVFVLILSILILLLVNNKEKSSFRYFIWEIQNISVGKLIFISFISGLSISTVLNKTLTNYPQRKYIKTEEDQSDDNDYSSFKEDSNETFEMPPQRDVREPQPTISVNYRVIKKNNEYKPINEDENTNNPTYEDDWDSKKTEW